MGQAIVLSVGLICCVVSVLLFVRTIRFRRRATRLLGTVTRVEVKESTSTSSSGSSTSTFYSPTVSFKMAAGRRIEFTPLASTTTKFVKGQRIHVLCDPKCPDDARIDEFSHQWLTALVFAVVGVTLSIVGFFLPSGV